MRPSSPTSRWTPAGPTDRAPGRPATGVLRGSDSGVFARCIGASRGARCPPWDDPGVETTRSRLVPRAGHRLPSGHAGLVRRQRRRRAGGMSAGHGSAWVGSLAVAAVLVAGFAVGATLAFTVSVAVY